MIVVVTGASSSMYGHEVEESWLNYATRLLLQLTTRSPNFDRELFDALTDCEFKEVHIQTWPIGFVDLSGTLTVLIALSTPLTLWRQAYP